MYVQSAERISNIKLTNALKDHMVITNIAPYSTPAGKLQDEWGSKAVRANESIVAKADATAVFVHPLGMESLQHITSEFIADLLNTLHGVDVFYKFGIKLYPLEQNVNFRARKGDKRVRLCPSGNGWITVPKDEAYDDILRILVDKTREAVRMFSGVLPPCHIDHSEKHAESILDSKDSPVPEQRKLYERMRIRVLNNIAVNVTDNLSRLSNWGGQKRNLVHSAPLAKPA